MATILPCFWGILFFSLSLYLIPSTSTSHVYIVYLGLNPFHDPVMTSNTHFQLLSDVFASEEEAKQSLLYSYKHSFSGFSARLNSTQVTSISKMKGVISVFRSKILKLHTTRSWDFLGLHLDYTTNRAATPFQWKYRDDVVVGVLDSGIWPESESFKEDQCLGPIPPLWKGKCEKGEEFEPRKVCNNKLIGARYYIKGFEQEYGTLNTTGNDNPEYRSPRDFLGHGTHTASTAVGSIVKNNVSFLGFGQGVARGGAPRARLAVYKTCWGKELEGRCAEADILAAFDDALRDGVGVISASFGASPPLAPFFASASDIGAFHSMQKGVSVVFSGGNDGPDPSYVGNVSPWSICVAATSVDRAFPTRIALNSSFSIVGESFVTKEITGKLANARMYFTDGVCNMENWNKRGATGRIILCFSNVESSGRAQEAVKTANGSALIYVQPPSYQIPDLDIVPTILVDISQGSLILDFLAQFAKLPQIRILPSKSVIGKSLAPVVAPYSSRGPSSISPDFLKPDLSAPGINILAAWPTKTPPTLQPMDGRSVEWNFQSGTSMSCPHVSGLAALLKSAYPDWSPAAIRSALITTASTTDISGDNILAGGSRKITDPFDIGAGQIYPLKAMDPGLIYDIKPTDYINFLCNIGYTDDQITSLVLPNSDPTIQTCCPKIPKSNQDINYPSVTVSNLNSIITVRRTVKNVGRNRNAVYFVTTVKPNGVEVAIWPRVLVFSYFREEISYYVTLKPLKKSKGRYDFGDIVWSDGFDHHVRSPLVVLVNNVVDDDDDVFVSST
ncbi:Subtilisin-like protease SBT3.18 [Euphorbia peplus]|nr:Subtilisin-like protease SBT3.18 [Euphorbia peplus]